MFARSAVLCSALAVSGPTRAQSLADARAAHDAHAAHA
jgi:hypothetical protein